METTTIASRGKERPSNQGLAEQPARKTPPWILTSTGSPAPGDGSGANTLRFRTSWPGMTGSGISSAGPGVEIARRCTVGPKRVASCGSVHGRGGSGAAKPKRADRGPGVRDAEEACDRAVPLSADGAVGERDEVGWGTKEPFKDRS